jgi:hypothetical protein
MRRREFIGLLGGAAAVASTTAWGQQPLPVIGLLDPRSPETVTDRLRGFRQASGKPALSRG